MALILRIECDIPTIYQIQNYSQIFNSEGNCAFTNFPMKIIFSEAICLINLVVMLLFQNYIKTYYEILQKLKKFKWHFNIISMKIIISLICTGNKLQLT